GPLVAVEDRIGYQITVEDPVFVGAGEQLRLVGHIVGEVRREPAVSGAGAERLVGIDENGNGPGALIPPEIPGGDRGVRHRIMGANRRCLARDRVGCTKGRDGAGADDRPSATARTNGTGTQWCGSVGHRRWLMCRVRAISVVLVPEPVLLGYSGPGIPVEGAGAHGGHVLGGEGLDLLVAGVGHF